MFNPMVLMLRKKLLAISDPPDVAATSASQSFHPEGQSNSAQALKTLCAYPQQKNPTQLESGTGCGKCQLEWNVKSNKKN